MGEPAQITKALAKSSKLPEEVILGLGLVLALAAPVLMDRLDHSIRTAKTAAVAFDSIVLTSIPPASRKEQRELVLPGTPSDGAYRALAATSIATDRLPEAIVVTSPTGTVQDTVAANFAAALAGLGLRVALVATDARQAWFLDTCEAAESGLPFPQPNKPGPSRGARRRCLGPSSRLASTSSSSCRPPMRRTARSASTGCDRSSRRCPRATST